RACAKVPADLRNCSGKTREHLALLLKQILALWPCPHGEKRSISATHAMRSTSDLAFRVRVLASVGSPNLIQDFAPLSIRPRTLGSPMRKGGTFGTLRLKPANSD